LKRATTTTKRKIDKVGVEPKTFDTSDFKHICYTTTLMPIISNCVQHIFPEGQNFF